MKVRFYPTKEAVMALLEKDLEGAENDKARCLERLTALKGSLLVVGPGKLEMAEAQLADATDAVAWIHSRIELLSSHKPAEVMAELDLNLG